MTESQKESVLARLASLTESSDDTLLTLLIDDAEAFVLTYTNRTAVPTALLRTVGDLAIVAYNRLGTEGESRRSEAGESYSFEAAPAHIFTLLNKYRIARCGGIAHETEQG